MNQKLEINLTYRLDAVLLNTLTLSNLGASPTSPSRVATVGHHFERASDGAVTSKK